MGGNPAAACSPYAWPPAKWHGRQPGGRLFAVHLLPYTPELGSIEI